MTYKGETQSIEKNQKMAESVTFSTAMCGGDDANSYTKNSSFQRKAASVVKESIDDIIAKKLEIKIPSGDSNYTVRIVDVGCSTGPNTFFAVHDLVEAIKHKYLQHCLNSQMPEFQVFFSDQVTNDFNTLFKSLAQDRPYFAAGVPGSFYNRLFPDSSIDLVYSSMALHWLSKVPEEVLDNKSASCNKGRIHYVNAPGFVLDAYETQYRKDMEKFLDARAKEVVQGGMVILVMTVIKPGTSFSQSPTGIMLGCLELSLMDLVKQGLITEAKVDSFNIPMYVTSAEEMTEIVKGNENFKIETIEVKEFSVTMQSAKEFSVHVRAGMGGMFGEHFGEEHVEDLFNLLEKKLTDSKDLSAKHNGKRCVLFVGLKRK